MECSGASVRVQCNTVKIEEIEKGDSPTQSVWVGRKLSPLNLIRTTVPLCLRHSPLSPLNRAPHPKKKQKNKKKETDQGNSYRNSENRAKSLQQGSKTKENFDNAILQSLQVCIPSCDR